MHPIDRIPTAPRFALAPLVLALLCGAPAAAQSDEPAERTLIGHLEAEIEDVRLQLINAGARLRGGAVSLGGSAENPTPGQICCQQNVETLQRHFREMSAIWGELRDCYRAEGNPESEIQANFVRDDAASLVRAMGNFVSAPNREGAVGGYQAMIRAFRQVVESSGKLAECGGPRVRDRAQ